MRRWSKKRDPITVRNYWLLGSGLMLALLGGIGTGAFLYEIQKGGRIPPGQIAARLILPHIALLAGLGLMLAAVILLRKHTIIQERKPEEE